MMRSEQVYRVQALACGRGEETCCEVRKKRSRLVAKEQPEGCTQNTCGLANRSGR